MRRVLATSLVGLALAGSAAGSPPMPMSEPVEIDRTEYADRLRAMWLAESIANWTGLRGEGQRIVPPFPTDADWGTDLGRGVLTFVRRNPWPADDDTDIEYVYAHLIDQAGSPSLTSGEIRDGWIAHINRFIWVSNERARELMDRGVAPPATSLPVANAQWLQIDAQLTTEFFGALAPGMPRTALELADLPIATTARGHAAHASQFHVVLYALAPVVPEHLTPGERVLWLIDEARRWIPGDSKAADIVDFVRADYLANPDVNDWESTRDRIYQRYQLNAASNGFVYRGWTESSVNFATGIMALLYGEGDFLRTVQIATLSGWDADNPAATMGGLLGLMYGTQAIQDAMGPPTLSDRYWSLRTRDNLPDYLPGDTGAEDTFTMLADRLLDRVDDAVGSGGGRVSPVGTGWLVPGLPIDEPLALNPLVRARDASGLFALRENGATIVASSSVVASPPGGLGVTGDVSFIANGVQTDASGREVGDDASARAYSSQGGGSFAGDWVSLSVAFDQTLEIVGVRFVEGDRFEEPGAVGGWFTEMTLEVRSAAGVWSAVPGAVPSEPLDAGVPFQVIDFALPGPMVVTGVRVVGRVGGGVGGIDAFVTCAELDPLLGEADPGPAGLDLNRDGLVGVEDLYRWHRDPVDLTGDAAADGADLDRLMRAVRWQELEDMTAGRR
ncbi:MAG: ADP-ribosylglycohydrolase family protein [Phycisphaerales bacterium JB037]